MKTVFPPLLVSVLAVCAAAAAPARAPDAPHRSFPEGTVIDVTKPPYNVTPDDGEDDTAAVQRAISDHVSTGAFLYFPEGTYNFSAPLINTNRQGLFRPHLTFQGAGRDRTVFRLRDNAPAFADAAHPAALLNTGSHQEPGDAPDGGGNKAFRNHVLDLTIDTGRGNPGAIAVNWAVSNIGSLENLRLIDGDGGADCGIALRRSIPGPGLIKNVIIEGFRFGVDLDDIQYGITVSGLTLRNQRDCGIRVGKNLLHASGLRSVNSVPAVRNQALEGSITLVHSRLEQPEDASPQQPLLAVDGTLLLLQTRLRPAVAVTNVAPSTVVCGGRPVPALRSGLIPYFYRAPSCPAGTQTPSWTLPHDSFAIPEPPLDANPDLPSPLRPEDCAVVGDRLSGEENDLPAIRRALNAGRPIVFFRTGKVYFIPDAIDVPDHVRVIHGMGAELSLGPYKDRYADPEHPWPVFRIGATRPANAPLWFEHVFFNTQYPGVALFENRSGCNLIIRHTAGWVGADGHGLTLLAPPPDTPSAPDAPAQGTMYAEDTFLPNWRFRNQRAVLVQFNPENFQGDGTEPLVSNHGGDLAILGFKTEGPAPYLRTVGGRSSVLGAYNYVSALAKALPTDRAPYETHDGRHFIHAIADNFGAADYPVMIRETTAPANLPTRIQTPKDLPMRNNHPGISWYGLHDFSQTATRPDLPAHLPYENPPSPLLFGGRTEPADRATWERELQPAIRETLLRTVYGHMPPKEQTPKLSWRIVDDTPDALDGLARRLQIDVTFDPPAAHPWRILLYLPANAKGPVPIFWGLNFKGIQTIAHDPGIRIPEWYAPVRPRGDAASRYDLPQILAAGCGLATMRHYEAEVDNPEGWKKGIRGTFEAQTGFPANGPDSWGAISAWAWSLSRGMDVFEAMPDLIGPVIVWGHSRLGKTALVAGATDPRFAAIISNCSGCTGASLSRSILPGAKSETVRAINDQFPHWFCENYKAYNDRENALPADQHHLLALCAPRPVLVNSAEGDVWADPEGEFRSTLLASPVWALYGHEAADPATPLPPLSRVVGDGVWYSIRPGVHDVTSEDWSHYLEFLRLAGILPSAP